jgi:hypothetical protein
MSISVADVSASNRQKNRYAAGSLFTFIQSLMFPPSPSYGSCGFNPMPSERGLDITCIYSELSSFMMPVIPRSNMRHTNFEGIDFYPGVH